MTDAITPEIFKHIVGLAALELDQEEAEYLRRELNGQLQSIRELEAIEVAEQVPITSHGVPYSAEARPPLRADAVKQSDLAAAIMDQAPQVEEGYIVVPEIPYEELE